MPRMSEQLEAMRVEQQDTLASFVMGALMGAAPNKAFLVDMVRLACDHAELERLEQLLTIKDDTVRGGMFCALIGDVAARAADEGVRRYVRGGVR